MRPVLNLPLMSLLSSDLVSAMTAAGRTILFEDGRTIHARGADQPGLSVILSGRVRFGVFSEEGAYYYTGLLNEGHCFGEATLFADMPRAYHADAVGETTVLSLTKTAFNRLFDDRPDFARAFLSTLTSRLYEALDFADDLRRLSLEAKVVKQLFRIQRVGGFEDDSLPIRQIDLAYALGVSRVSVGKALERLQARGLIQLGYGEIRVLDRKRLAESITDKTGL
ncbi:MAG: Crp/Fnr family transcriptional regulator [Pseudomonadota bacterium]